jgi:ATPase subunit of ABC transporter with duplicated ATPase domains
MLARVLLAEPSVLLLDEPTNHLDAAGIGWLGGYLADFPGALLVVTHDRAFLDRVVTTIVELDGIHDEPRCYTGNYTAYLAEKQRRWERLLLDYEAQEKARARLAEDIERTRGQAEQVERTVRRGPGADKIRRYARKVARKAKARERRLRRQMLSLSAGELRRLLLATMVNSGAEVLLLDEPTNYLDFDSLDVVEAPLRAFTGTLVMVTHDRYLARAVGCTRRLVLDDGHVHEPGQVELGGDGHGVGGAVAVLGDDEVRLPGAG